MTDIIKLLRQLHQSPGRAEDVPCTENTHKFPLSFRRNTLPSRLNRLKTVTTQSTAGDTIHKGEFSLLSSATFRVTAPRTPADHPGYQTPPHMHATHIVPNTTHLRATSLIHEDRIRLAPSPPLGCHH